jgi:hypothetical protein
MHYIPIKQRLHTQHTNQGTVTARRMDGRVAVDQPRNHYARCAKVSDGRNDRHDGGEEGESRGEQEGVRDATSREGQPDELATWA